MSNSARKYERWRVQLYPHSGRFLVSNGPLEVFGTAPLASFAVESDAQRFADARNAWEQTAPKAEEFGGCGPFPKPDRYDVGRAVFDSDPALRPVNYSGQDESVECAYPPCTNRLRRSDFPGPQWCSKEHRDAEDAEADRSDSGGSLFAVSPETCTHPREMWRFLRTYSDWFDGDEDDIYECGCCGKKIREYVPR